jgi:hypothetical protein
MLAAESEPMRVSIQMNQSGFGSFAGTLLVLTVLAVSTPAPAQPAEAAGKPFDNMSGAWSGTGSITLGSGDKVSIRCRVTYKVENDGYRVGQDLRCASDSYKFELLSDISYANGFITGRWDEKSRNTSGTISGRAMPGRIEALAETGGFAALFTMVTRGDSQSVRIESKSPEISDVTITLRRSR